MNNTYNSIDSARNTYESISEAEIIADFNGQSSDGFDEDFDTCFVPNGVHHVPTDDKHEGFDACDDWDDEDSAYTGDAFTAQTPSEADPFDTDEAAQRDEHSQLVKGLLLTFIDEHQSVTAADICGSERWDWFSDDEKRSAARLIAELIEEMRLPLMADSKQSYPEPRSYFFI